MSPGEPPGGHRGTSGRRGVGGGDRVVGDRVERQVAEALARGGFNDLPGAGKPIPDLDEPLSALGWAVRWARREGADLTAALPLALAMRREREQLVDAVPTLASEAAVRAMVADFNARLDAGYRRPQGDPPLATPFLDVERQVARWREARPPPAPPVAPLVEDVAARRRRRPWWRRG